MATGHNLIVGFKKNGNTWGSGAAVVCGAGDGVEVEGESVAIGANLIENQGLSGQGTRLPSKLGNKLVQGDLGPCPLYYRGLEVLLASAMGDVSGGPNQLGGTAAYEHPMNLKASHAGIFGTLAMAGVDHPAVREIPFAKVGGFTLDFAPNELAKATFPIVGYDLHLNVDTPDADGLVASTDVADGTYTIVGQPAYPTFLTLTITDANASVTEHVVTVVGTDEDGNYYTDTYTLSVDGLTWTSAKRFASITSVTGSGTAGTVDPGTDTIVMGYQFGTNNVSNYSSIALPSSADHELVTFDQLTVLMNEQSAGALSASDAVYVDAVRVSLALGLTQLVTTKFGNRVEDPVAGDFKSVEIGLNFPSWDSANNAILRDRLQAKRHKVKITASGPLAATGYALELSIWLNEVQFGEGSPNAGGPGPIRFDLTGMGHRALSSPTGLPTWADTAPISLRLVNLRTTSALA